MLLLSFYMITVIGVVNYGWYLYNDIQREGCSREKCIWASPYVLAMVKAYQLLQLYFLCLKNVWEWRL